MFNQRVLWFVKSLFCLSLLVVQPVQAQIRADETLLRRSNVNARGNRLVITGGTRTGNNLFHSFREFSVPPGRTASFQQVDAPIANVISRVTGSSVSRIDGTVEVLQSNGQVSSANLFLINPNGIYFGPNAALNIGGSFLATTGDRLNFADGTQFRADGTQSSPLLTVSVPIGIQFGQAPGTIINQSRTNLRLTTDRSNDAIAGGLQVAPGRTLALVGGHIRLPRGVLVAEGGRIELGAIGANESDTAQVSLTSVNSGWRLGYEAIRNFQDLQFSRNANVSVSGAGGGSIQIRGRQIGLTGQSYISSLNRENLDGESIHIRANQLNISDRSRIRTFTQGSGIGGNIWIDVERLHAQSGGQIATNTGGMGNGGNIWLNAADAVILSGSTLTNNGLLISALSSNVNSSATGNGGRLTISTRTLRLQGGAQINAITSGAGDAGSIQIQAETVELVDVARDTAGNIIYTPERPRPYPSGLFAGTRNRASGNGGDLLVETERLSLRDGAAIKTNTEGSGDSGDLTIHASDWIEASGRVPGDSLPSLILTSSGGVPGIDNSGVDYATGQGGDLLIDTQELRVREGGTIAVGSSNPNEQRAAGAGNLFIEAETVRLENQGRLLAETASGDGGNIELHLDDLLLLRDNSRVSASAGQEGRGGNGGNITLNTHFILAAPSENSDITANAFTGDGGNIRIDALGVLGIESRQEQTSFSDITANSTFGESGTIEINGSVVDPNRGLVDLPTAPLHAQMAQQCQSNGDTSVSRFVETGLAGLPPGVSETDNEIWDDLRFPGEADHLPSHLASELVAEPSRPRLPPMQIIEAQGWRRREDGKVILTASVPATVPYSSWRSPVGCHASEHESEDQR